MQPNLMTLEAILALGVVVGVLYGPWQKLIIEIARQRLFNIRGAVFDYAASGRLPFESEAYRAAMRQLNMLIRFSHTVTWPHFLFMTRFAPQAGSARPLEELVQAMPDPEAQAFIQEQVAKAGRTLGWMLFFRSPLLMLVSVPVWIWRAGKARTMIASAGRILEREILQEGESAGRYDGHAHA